MTEWRQTFLHTRTGKVSTSLREIYGQCSEQERQLSAEFYGRYPAGRGTGRLTPFAGILQGPGPLAGGDALVRGDDRAPQAAKGRDLEARLSRALAESLPPSTPLTTEVAVAVSGGVDCWLLAALLKHLGYRVCGWYLETGIPGYCEREQVERSSAALGIPCRYIRVAATDFVACLAEFTAVTQTPIYNLHPVSKWLLAKALREEGIKAVVTGDAADQVMRWEWECDLLPLTIACFQGAGIRMVAPFMADEVVGFARQPYPDKQPVRDLAQRFGVPTIAKQPTLFPPLTLPSRPRASLPAPVAGDMPAHADRARCLAYTTGLLQGWLAEAARCAG